MRHLAGATTFIGSFPSDTPVIGLPEIALVGRSNVGKSSAINRLLMRTTARVSRTPGRTQTVNLFRLGDGMVVADLPGYGFAKVPDAVHATWDTMMADYLGGREDLRLVIVLVDARREPQELDRAMLDLLEHYAIPSVVVATKVDKLTRNQRHAALGALRRGLVLPADQPLAFSSHTGEGRDALWDRIERACGGGRG
jgi:GTP-binding protein